MLPYLNFNKLCQMEFGSDRILQSHLLSRAMLNHSKCFTLKHPSFLSLQTLSRLNQLIFLFNPLPPQRKSRYIFIISLTTTLGALKKERQEIEMLFINAFKRVTFPPIERFLPFQVDNLLLNFSTILFQEDFLLGLIPTLNPKNMNEKFPMLQDKNVKATYITS